MKHIRTIIAFIGFTLSLNAFAASGEWTDINAAAEKKDIKLAVSLAKKLADKGNPDAQSFVGSMLLNGYLNAAADAKTAVHYLELTVANPNTEDEARGNAYWLLNTAYLMGNGVQKDMESSFKNMWSAARFGNAKATNKLTNAICKGRGEDCPAILQQRITQCQEPCLQ